MAHIWFLYWNSLKISFRWCSLLNWNCISGSDWTLFPDQLFAAKFDAWDINQDGVIDSEEVARMSKKISMFSFPKHCLLMWILLKVKCCTFESNEYYNLLNILMFDFKGESICWTAQATIFKGRWSGRNVRPGIFNPFTAKGFPIDE